MKQNEALGPEPGQPGGSAGQVPELGVLLAADELGDHGTALLAWLADARQRHQLRVAIGAPTAELAHACHAAGLGDCLSVELGAVQTAGALHRSQAFNTVFSGKLRLLRALQRWPRGIPLLLAPHALQAQTGLLATALALQHVVWVAVPLAFSARHMGCPQGTLREHMLARLLGGVKLWITPGREQCDWLHRHWRLRAPVLVLPALQRLALKAGAMSIRPAGGRSADDSGDGRLRLTCVGPFDLHQKGLDWLADLLRNEPPWRLHHRWTFTGRGPGEPVLQALASALGPQHLLVQPPVPLAQALAESDLLLLASRYEGVPRVALEATALGWPVIASRQSGLGAVLPPQSQFEFGDGPGLNQALERMRSPHARAEAVAHAQQRLMRLHGPQPYQQALAVLMSHLRRAPQPACQPTGRDLGRAGEMSVPGPGTQDNRR